MQISRRLAISVAVTAFGALVPQMASAERVCRQECAGPVCQERCVETDGRAGREGRERFEERREERREERFEDRRDRGPGIELRVPGIEIEKRS
jgi:hypothetical protein